MNTASKRTTSKGRPRSVAERIKALGEAALPGSSEALRVYGVALEVDDEYGERHVDRLIDVDLALSDAAAVALAQQIIAAIQRVRPVAPAIRRTTSLARSDRT